MKKVFVLLLVLIIIAIAVLFFTGGFGLFNGSGNGSGESDAVETEAVETNAVETEAVEPVVESDNLADDKTVTIEVSHGEYIIDGEITSITKIESIIAEDIEMELVYVLDDNYGSARAWDELKALFIEYGVSYTEN